MPGSFHVLGPLLSVGIELFHPPEGCCHRPNYVTAARDPTFVTRKDVVSSAWAADTE